MKPEIQKLLWRSRRGMLELDTLFKGYIEERGDGMTAEQFGLLESLLEYQDQEIFDAFSGKQPLPNSQHEAFLQSMLG